MIAAMQAVTSEWINDMNATITDSRQSEADILSFDVSDAALEAAAMAMPGAAMSFPQAPTVSILVVCCSNDSNAADTGNE
jgi:hypothetical protein